jgi:hypothetical protein
MKLVVVPVLAAAEPVDTQDAVPPEANGAPHYH